MEKAKYSTGFLLFVAISQHSSYRQHNSSGCRQSGNLHIKSISLRDNTRSTQGTGDKLYQSPGYLHSAERVLFADLRRNTQRLISTFVNVTIPVLYLPDRLFSLCFCAQTLLKNLGLLSTAPMNKFPCFQLLSWDILYSRYSITT